MAAASSPMRIAFPSGMNGQLVVTMDKAGIAQTVGLQAEYSSFQYGPPMMEALASGSLDAVVTSLMPVTAYAAKLPNDLKIVAMVGNSSHSLMVNKQSAVSNINDLAGKTVGVSFGSDSHLDVLNLLRDSGLVGKVALVNVAPDDLVTALSNNSVDAIVIRQPQVLKLQRQTGARIVQSWPFRFVATVKAVFIRDHPDEFKKFLLALREAIFYIAQHQQQSAAWFGEYLKVEPSIIEEVSRDDPNFAVSSLEKVDISVTPAAREIIGKWADDAYREKMIRRQVDLPALFQ